MQTKCTTYSTYQPLPGKLSFSKGHMTLCILGRVLCQLSYYLGSSAGRVLRISLQNSIIARQRGNGLCCSPVNAYQLPSFCSPLFCSMPGLLVFVLLLAAGFWLHRVYQTARRFLQFWEIRTFYHHALGISTVSNHTYTLIVFTHTHTWRHYIHTNVL